MLSRDKALLKIWADDHFAEMLVGNTYCKNSEGFKCFSDKLKERLVEWTNVG